MRLEDSTHLVQFGGCKVYVAGPPRPQRRGKGQIQHVAGSHQTIELGELEEVDGSVGLDRQAFLLSLESTLLYLNLTERINFCSVL